MHQHMRSTETVPLRDGRRRAAGRPPTGPDAALALQRAVGNRATAALLQRPATSVQRRGLDASWTTDSRAGKDDRSAPMQAIDTTVAQYVNLYLRSPGTRPWDELDGAPAELSKANARQALTDILDAIDRWRADKRGIFGGIRSRRAAAVDDLERDVRHEPTLAGAATEDVRAAARGQWGAGATTDPTAHDDRSWRYLINGLTPSDGSPATVHRNLIQQNPDAVKKHAGVMSVSYITETLNSVWAPSGYILKVPGEDVLAASTTDMGVDNALLTRSYEEERRRLGVVKGVATPQQLRDQGVASKHNEIAVRARSVTFTGIFILQDTRKVTPQPRPVQYALRVKGRNGVPLTHEGHPIVEGRPGVSEEWLRSYQATSAQRGIPIRWLRQAAGANIAMPAPEGGMWPSAVPRDAVWLEDLPEGARRRVDLARGRLVGY